MLNKSITKKANRKDLDTSTCKSIKFSVEWTPTHKFEANFSTIQASISKLPMPVMSFEESQSSAYNSFVGGPSNGEMIANTLGLVKKY